MSAASKNCEIIVILLSYIAFTQALHQQVFSLSHAELSSTNVRPERSSRLKYSEDDNCYIMNEVWSLAGESVAKDLPMKPSKKLEPYDVIVAVIRGIQYVDIPRVNKGLERCYNFMDIFCKKMVTGIGNIPEERTLEAFIDRASKSPNLKPFMGADSVTFGPLSKIPGTRTRGEIVTMPVKVQPASDVFESSKEKTFMVRLQRQRRPPLAGAYLVTDIIDVASVCSISRPLAKE